MILFSVLVALIGLALVIGGFELLSLGGSIYYLLAGIYLLLNAWLGFKRHGLTRPLFALFLVVTLFWSFWESGYDWWALAPRMGLFMFLAIPLLISNVASKGGRIVLFPVWAVLGVITLGSLWANPHGLWDMDTPAQPSLIDLDTESGLQPALVVPSKQGDVYVLNRETGEPIFPIEELPAPQGTVALDDTSPTQPISALTFRPPNHDRKRHVGSNPTGSAVVPDQVQITALRGPVHTAIGARHAGLPR